MDLTWTIEDAAQSTQTRIVSFKWLLPLTGLEAPESSIDGRVFGVIAIISMLESVAWGFLLLSLVSDIPGFPDVLPLWANQLSSPAQKWVMSVVRAAMDFGFSWPRCRASHSSRMLCLKAARASASRQSTI